jgi:hypothetical protein
MMIDTKKIVTVWSAKEQIQLAAEGWRTMGTGIQQFDDGTCGTNWHMYPPAPTLAERMREMADDPENINVDPPYIEEQKKAVLLFRQVADALERADKIEAAAQEVTECVEWADYDDNVSRCRFCGDEAQAPDLIGHKSGCQIAGLMNALDAKP